MKTVIRTRKGKWNIRKARTEAHETIKHYFTLKASNGSVLGTSKMYTDFTQLLTDLRLAKKLAKDINNFRYVVNEYPHSKLHHWTLCLDGDIILTSEVYTTEQGCKNGIDSAHHHGEQLNSVTYNVDNEIMVE